MKLKKNIINLLKDINSENKRKKFLVYFFTSASLLTYTAFGIKGFTEGKITYSIILLVFFILAITNLIILKVFKKINFSVYIMIFLMLLLGLVLFSSLGVGISALFWYYVFPPLAITLLDNKKGTIYSFVLIALTLIIYIAKPDFLINTYSNKIVFRFIFAYLVVVFLINIFEYARNTAYKAYLSNLDKLKDKNDELTIAEEELRQNYDELQLLTKNIQIQKDIIHEKEHRLKTIIDNQGEGFAIIALDGTFIFNNPAAEYIFDLPPTGLYGRNIFDFFDKEQTLSFESLVTQLKYQKKETIELQILTLKGIKKTIVVTITPDFDDENKISGLSGIIRDITEIKKAEEKIQEKNEELLASEEELRQNNEELLVLNQHIEAQKNIIQEKELRLKTIIDNQGEGFGITDLNENFIFINRVGCEIFGVGNGNLIGRNLKEFVEDQEWNRILEQTQSRKDEMLNTYELTITLPDKSKKHLMVTGAPDYDINRNVVGTIGTYRDITELKQKQETIEQLNKELQNYFTAIEQSAASIIFTDIKGNIEYVNPQYTKVTGYTKEEVLGKNPRILKSEKTPDETYINLWNSISNGKTWRGEFINIKKDGTEFSEPAIITQIKNNKGEISSFIAIKEDITELRKAQQIIEEKTAQQQILINNLPAHIYFKDKNLKYMLVNNSYAQLLNHSKHEIIGKTDNDVAPAEIADMYQKLDSKIIQSKTSVINFERKHINNKGQEYWASTSKVPYFDDNNNVIGIVGIMNDISERKNQEKLIIEKNKQISIAYKNITDSIKYAKSIQNALLPTQELEKELLKEHFILFLPKENVSGDFYYVNKPKDNKLLFAVADCTGHGVPGGFMTMLSITILNGIIRRDKEIIPSTILEQLRGRIKGIFSQFGTENQNGLDIAFCSVDTKTNILQYAGAFNPLWIIRNNELLEFKATRNPIGFYPVETEFKNYEIQLYNNDIIYIFSDGYQDQPGGEGKGKFFKKRFRNKLLEIHNLALTEQKIELTKTLQEWINGVEQIDDITVMGIKWIIK